MEHSNVVTDKGKNGLESFAVQPENPTFVNVGAQCHTETNDVDSISAYVDSLKDEIKFLPSELGQKQRTIEVLLGLLSKHRDIQSTKSFMRDDNFCLHSSRS